MISSKDNQMVAYQNEIFELAAFTKIADRAQQQDCFGIELNDRGALMSICDGMGGQEEGRRASQLCVETTIARFGAMTEENTCEPVMQIQDAYSQANKSVSMFQNERGEKIESGTTAVTVFVRDNKLYWCSVGDSRAYLMRGNECVQLTHDQNYRCVLDEKKYARLISEDEYRRELVYGDRLINYIGIGHDLLFDYSVKPVALTSNDRIIIMSDGIYRMMDDSRISRVARTFRKAEDTVRAIENEIFGRENNNIKKDNATIIVLKIY